MNDQMRNLNPPPEARVAMIIWGQEYSEGRGGSMDFWDGLSDERKERCLAVVEMLHTLSFEEIQRDLDRRKAAIKATREALDILNGLKS